MIGRTLGHYEILEPLGAGGMGEVYRARDKKLERDVAVKVLPGDFGADRDHLARFEREAKLLAALNHPNIATIHGLEESDGVRFIVMELVEGETLADRIARSGRIEIGEALEIARQIAEALEVAHDEGVVHRDVKPANVMLTSRGNVKVLDFGIAKSTVLDVRGGETAQVTSLTMDGTLMGTPPYMSPEQIRGGQVDEKTDVWASGCVLFEMLTGARVFAAETASDTLADILTKEPDWGALPKATPERVRDLLERVFRKDPDRRQQRIGDVRIELQEALASFSESPVGNAPKMLAALLGVATLALAAGWYLLGDGGDPELRREREAVAPGEIRSIVVLPLKNLMNDPGQSYFVEGMHEALITELSKIKALRVISRTTAMRYEGSGKTVPEIARELGVDAVVEGSVLRAGNVVRVTAQLIDARSDSHIWADNFDRELGDILALYADVTREIVDHIRVTLTPAENARLAISRPIDPEVYDLYLKGRYLCGNWSPEEMQQGIKLLQQAVNLDPRHAASQAQLALCLVDTVFFDYMTPMEIDSRARAAALTAVQLDDRLAEAHVALGSVSYYLEFKPRSAEGEYLRALELNPNSVDALLHLAWLRTAAGRFDEAAGPMQRAAGLDPLSTAVRNAIGQLDYLNRDFDRAIQGYETALELDRSDPSLHFYLAGPFEQKGQYERAIALYESAIELSGGASLYLSALGHAYGLAGMREEALQILEQLQQTGSPSPYNLAIVHLGLGHHEQAIDLLEEAFEARNTQMVYINRAPKFDPLRQNERFVSLLARFEW